MEFSVSGKHARPQPSPKPPGINTGTCTSPQTIPLSQALIGPQRPSPKPTHSAFQARREHTPHSSHSRMMTCRRAFERRARRHWSLAATCVRAGVGRWPRFASSGDTPFELPGGHRGQTALAAFCLLCYTAGVGSVYYMACVWGVIGWRACR
jgi:hypothetical protein